MRYLLFILCACASWAGQASNAVGGPVIGLVLDANSQARPVLGVPGAASLGPAVALDPAIQVVAISPHQDYLLGARGDARDLTLIRNPLGTPAVSAIAGVSGVASISLSPAGSAAVVQAAGSAMAQVLSGLPDGVTAAWQADLSALPSAAAGLAVSDDGTAVVAAAVDGDHTSLFLITADAGARMVAAVGQLGGLAFIAGHGDILFGDAQANLVQIIRDVTGAASLATLADSTSGVSGPLEVAASEDGQRVFAVTSNPAGVLILDRASNTQQQVTCNCSPAGLARLSRAAVFRLTDSTAGLFWVLDAGAAAARIVAIPPDASAAGISQ